MSRVFVIQVPKKGGYKLDISAAEEFGTIQAACFESSIDIVDDSKNTIEQLHEYFSDFTDEDCILQVGEHTLFTAACVVASNYVDRLNILKWDRDFSNGKRSGGYYSKVELNLD